MDETGEYRRGGRGRYRTGSSRPGGDDLENYEKSEKNGDDFVVVTNRVYVTNLAYHTTWQNLKDHMRTAGEVVYADVFLDDYGKSKGCGIVEFKTVEEALTAINTLNETKLDGREIYIREDKEDKNIKKYSTESVPSTILQKVNRSSLNPKNSSSSSNSKRTNESSDKGRQIFIGNLPFSTSWQDLKDNFRKCGKIIRADVLVGYDGRSKGLGTILFESSEDAQKAIESLNGTEYMGRIISVHEDKFA